MQNKLPNTASKFDYIVQDEETTQRLGADVSLVLQQGDMICLSGELGAGKSFLARSIIQTLAQNPNLEVPSPTYTICQHYETVPPIAHYDLYRLADVSELDELGWQETLETSVTLIEWPEQVFEILPPEAVHIQITDEGDTSRKFTFSGNQDLLSRIEHTLKIRNFIEQSPLAGASRTAFAADASARNYELVHHSGKTHYLMDAPRTPDGPPIKDGLPYSKIAHLAEDVSAFVAVDFALQDHDLCAPEIFAHDLDAGFLLIEGLGEEKIIDENRHPIEERYLASIEFLAEMHSKQFTSEIVIDAEHSYTIPDFDEGVILAETDLLLQWYAPEYSTSQITSEQANRFESIWKNLSAELDRSEQTLVLRDYHSPNIIWRDNETGNKRIGVIDFQDALIGPCAYDVASLAQDARVDVSAALEAKLITHYITLREENTANFDADLFKQTYAIMAAQRATKILGIFVRLNKRDLKPEYMAHLPRISDYLNRSLSHGILSEYKAWLRDVIKL